MKRVCLFFLTVYLAMSVRVALFPPMGNFCDLTWRLLGSSVQPVISLVAEKDQLETLATQRKPLPLYPPIRILHVWLVFVHARVFTITADSNARRYWLSTLVAL